MKHRLLLLLCLTSSACTHMHPPVDYVPPEEAAWFRLPYDLPQEGQEIFSGDMATAIQLAMDDFLPRHIHPRADASPRERCLNQRQAYDVYAAPLNEEVMLVQIVTSPGACALERAAVSSMGATYAVDVRHWRILAFQRP